jgi:hypothetical protein
MVAAVADDTVARLPLNLTVSLLGLVSKLVPVIVTAAFGGPIIGVKPVIVGPDSTVNEELLVAVPEPAVTLIVPVVAPVGTVATTCVGVADVIVAVMPLNLTVSWLICEMNPLPLIVTELPTGPLAGEKEEIVTGVVTVIERILPTASYW